MILSDGASAETFDFLYWRETIKQELRTILQVKTYMHRVYFALSGIV